MIKRKAFRIVPAALVLAIALAGTAMAVDDAVNIKTQAGIGPYLADGKGFTLYTFKRDSPGTSGCAGTCTERWPLFFARERAVAPGLDAKDFGAITRSDGKKQTTYKGMPLYYFIGDAKPGQITGQGFDKLWYAAKP